MFLVNSRLGHFSATGSPSDAKSVEGRRLPLSRSYGDILPSSLSTVLSIALESSSHLPASVCGTGTCVLARGFSWKLGMSNFAVLRLLGSAPRSWIPAGFARLAPYTHARAHPIARSPALLRSPIARNEREVVRE